jgi:homeobox protein CDX
MHGHHLDISSDGGQQGQLMANGSLSPIDSKPSLLHDHIHMTGQLSGQVKGQCLSDEEMPSRPMAARSPFGWLKKDQGYATIQPAPGSKLSGKTRTRDKYRVVYSEHQRVELEKEFHYSKYITIRRKSELANNLGLSERQVKIWFQNRRAKERKQNKKKIEMTQKSDQNSKDIRGQVDLSGQVAGGSPSGLHHHHHHHHLIVGYPPQSTSQPHLMVGQAPGAAY